MANDFNSCTFTGRLGRDCEAKYMSSGDCVANFSIAVGEQWKGKDGEKQEKTLWLNVVAYKGLAKTCSDYLKKGAHVLVSGKLQIREYEKDGVKKQTTELVLDKMQMLGGKREEAYAPAQHQSAPAPARSPTAPPDFDDDIPW